MRHFPHGSINRLQRVFDAHVQHRHAQRDSAIAIPSVRHTLVFESKVMNAGQRGFHCWVAQKLWFLSRVSTLTRDTDIANLSVRPSDHLSVCPSVRDVPVLDENGLTYRHSFFTIR